MTAATTTAAVAMHMQTVAAAEMAKQSFSRGMGDTQASLLATCTMTGVMQQRPPLAGCCQRINDAFEHLSCHLLLT